MNSEFAEVTTDCKWWNDDVIFSIIVVPILVLFKFTLLPLMLAAKINFKKIAYKIIYVCMYMLADQRKLCKGRLKL